MAPNDKPTSFFDCKIGCGRFFDAFKITYSYSNKKLPMSKRQLSSINWLIQNIMKRLKLLSSCILRIQLSVVCWITENLTSSRVTVKNCPSSEEMTSFSNPHRIRKSKKLTPNMQFLHSNEINRFNDLLLFPS